MKRHTPHLAAEHSPLIPVLIVQAIHSEWSKVSRGGPQATARNAVPEIIPLTLPQRLDTDMSYLIHHHFYSEATGFTQPFYDAVEQQPATVQTHYVCRRQRLHALEIVMPHTVFVSEILGPELIRYDRIHIIREAQRATITYRATNGAPYTNPSTFSLLPDHWIQIQYNARYGVDAGWVYDKWVFNIGLFHQVHAHLFLTTRPHKRHVCMSLLW